jgi:hypothetical protein
MDSNGNLLVELAQSGAPAMIPSTGISADVFTEAESGSIVICGELSDVDTSAWAVGDELWVSTSVAGNLTNVKPDGPDTEKVAQVLKSHATAGVLQVYAYGIMDSGNSILAEATATTTTDSTNYVLMDTMTITPAAGTYDVMFRTSIANSSTSSNYTCIYAGGVVDAASVVRLGVVNQTTGIPYPCFCMARVTVNGSQAIEGRWKVSTGTATAYERNLKIVKVS